MGRKEQSNRNVSTPAIDAEKEIIDPRWSIFLFATINRPWVLNPHLFYAKQAQERLLSQFNGVEIRSEATERDESFIESAGGWLNPDYHDGSDVYENIEQIETCCRVTLWEMGITVTLSLIIGMYHQSGRALRDLFIREAKS